MYLFHNTSDAVLIDPRSNGLYVKSPGSWDLVYARNNVWGGTEYALNNYNTSQPVDLDYDNLWNDGTEDLVRWDGTRYATLGAFNDATGQEAHGLNTHPGYTDPTNGDYRLDSGSALIDAGLSIPGINHEYNGSAPDTGAFEFEPSLVLHGTAGDQIISLSWTVNDDLPAGSTWRIDYAGPTGDQPSPITGIPHPTRSYLLTGLTNYVWYTVTLSAMYEDTAILADSVHLMPTDLVIYLPILHGE